MHIGPWRPVRQSTSSLLLLQQAGSSPSLHADATDLGFHRQQHSRPSHISPNPLFLRSVQQSKLYLYFLCLCIFCSFLLDSLRTLAVPPSLDLLVDSVLLACVFCFSCDIAVRVKVDRGYCWSLVFWLDTIATVGVVADVTAVYGAAVPECFQRGAIRAKVAFRVARLASGVTRLVRSLHANKMSKLPIHLQALDSSVASRRQSVQLMDRNAGDKYRITPFSQERDSVLTVPESLASRRDFSRVNTFRQLCNSRMEAIEKQETTQEEKSVAESELSKVMVSRIVLFLVLVALFSSWVGVVEMLPESTLSVQYGLSLLRHSEYSPRYTELRDEFISYHSQSESLHSLISLSVRGVTVWKKPTTTSIRPSDKCYINHSGYSATVSIVRESRIYAIFDVCTLAFICTLILVTCVQLSTDFRNMLLFPLERMLSTTELMAQNPLAFVKFSAKSREEGEIKVEKCCETGKNYAEEEIKLLENAFRKIGVMLAVVYGSAGSELISSTIQFNSGFSPLVPGRAITAVFCFVHLQHFEVFLDILRSDLISYVNLLSCIVHNVCEQHLGTVNRNLGDAFLLVWKIPDEENIVRAEKVVISPYSEVAKRYASLALLFAVKTIEKAGKSRPVYQYHHSKSLLRRGFAFSTALSFGLHTGWAYEGAIGSVFKIDASYLSPNVNLAARLESATRQYGVMVLASEEFREHLEGDILPYLRHIDTVRLKGVFAAIRLHTIDLAPYMFSLNSGLPNKQRTEKKRSRLQRALELEMISIAEMFTKSQTIALMRRPFKPSFYEQFAEGLQLYLSGRWDESRLLLEPLYDGPTRTLLEYMRQYQFCAPADWHGVRELLSK